MRTKQFRCSFFLLLLALVLNGQADENTNNLPALHDWFLATGDWQTDPQLYVRELGSGQDTVIVLHGGWGGEHSGMIKPVLPLLDQYRFIFYDQRGSLRSPFPDSLITFDNHIKDLERMRKELQLPKVTLLAHSMGSVLASAYAEKYPKHIEKLVLLAPAHLKNPIPEEDRPLQKIAQEQFDTFMNRPEVTQELAKYAGSETNAKSSRRETAKFRINFGRRMLFDITKWPELMGGRAIYQGHVFGLTANTYPENGWDYFDTFKRTDYPVHIIVGDHDFLDFGNPLIKKWTAEDPEISLELLKNAGHLLWLDQPERFTELLEKALEIQN